MKVVQRFQTADGRLHETKEIATRYADNLYGNALTSLAHKLLQIQKYKAMTEFLENNLQEFLEVQRLKDDIELKPKSDSCDE